MIQKEFQTNYQQVPSNITELEQNIIKQLKDNEYSLAETRYLFNYILEKIECRAIVGNIK